MPVMGGWQLLKNIQGLYKNMTRVIASGYIINSNDMNASGVSHLLDKPFKKEDVIKILDVINYNMATVGYSNNKPKPIDGKVA